jgi:hypothetical protein
MDGGNFFLSTNIAPTSSLNFSDNANCGQCDARGPADNIFTRKFEGLFVFAATSMGLSAF